MDLVPCVLMLNCVYQVYLEVCIRESEASPGLTTHKEIRPTSFLSNLACTIPLPDFNQSPRNMYQCQMGKQTMASPIHTWHLNSGTVPIHTLAPQLRYSPHPYLAPQLRYSPIHTWHLNSGTASFTSVTSAQVQQYITVP